MANASSPCTHASDMFVAENVAALQGHQPLEVVLNFSPFVSNTTVACETQRFRYPKPSLALPTSTSSISRAVFLFIFVVLLAWAGPVCRPEYAGQNGTGNDPETFASGRRSSGTDSYNALNSLESGYNPLGPHSSKRKRDRGPPHSTKSTSKKQARRTFACPFYLHDRIGHSDCLYITLKRLSDVRQHLLERAHNQVVHCPTCGEIFTGRTTADARGRRDAHIQAATCEPLLSPPDYPGITEDQERSIREIARNTRGNHYNEVHRWFRIWDFLFPGEPRPLSPFLTDEPNIQRVVDWTNEIFENDHWRQLRNEPWTTAMNLEQQRSGMFNFIHSFIDQARGILGHGTGSIDDDHGADVSSYIGSTNTLAPTRAAANRRAAPQASGTSRRPDEAAEHAYLSPSSLTGPHSYSHGLDFSMGDLPSAVAPTQAYPLTNPAVDVPQDTGPPAGPGDATDIQDSIPYLTLEGYPFFDSFDGDLGLEFNHMLDNENARPNDDHAPGDEDELGSGH